MDQRKDGAAIDNNLHYNEIKLPMSFFLTEFTQYKNKISKEGLSKVAEMPKAPKNCIIAQAKKEFTKHLLHINK